MGRLYWFAFSISFGLLILAGPATAATCESVAELKIPNTTITSAQAVRGTFTLPENSPAANSSSFTAFEKLRLPEFCRVQGVIAPTGDSHIEFEVWLPTSRWNGKYMGTGNGGFGGTINYYGLAEAVNTGYAASATDTGHRGDVQSVDWAKQHPEKVIDFNERAIHETATTSKAIIRGFYSAAPKWSYFNSCANGGRQALVEAIRYPGDYDGILAGAPSFNVGRDLAREQQTPFVDETVPNLKTFHQRGGKLILYHGERDRPADTVKFFEKIVATMGRKTAIEFVRLFVVPEMGHCGGGPVPEFGSRLQPNADPLHSMSAALEHWVEHRMAPDAIIATKYNVDDDASSGVQRTRPLCAYPMEAKFTGQGSADDAASYICRLGK